MSLDVYLRELRPASIFEQNITHNLGAMADKAGLYQCLWRPEEIDITKARQLIQPLQEGLQRLLDEPERFTAMNPPNGWGSYEGLIAFVKEYLRACEESPDADVHASR